MFSQKELRFKWEAACRECIKQGALDAWECRNRLEWSWKADNQMLVAGEIIQLIVGIE